MQVGWGKSPPRVVHIVGRRDGGVLCVFALWCMGTLALTSSIRSPQVAAAEEAKGGEEETAGAAGHLHTRKSQLVPWQMPCSAQCISVYSWHGPIASYQPARV